MAITYQPILNSTYLDFTGYRVTAAPTVEAAYGITDGEVSPYGINVALILPRSTDAAGLLAQDWGTRQETLQELNSNGTLWSTYGANATQYGNLVSALQSAPFDLEVLNGSTSEGVYISSAESRTIWVNLATAADFQTLFGTELMYSPSQEVIYWNGSLSLPSGWNVTGLWVDYDPGMPSATNLSAATPVTLTTGAQSIGNSTPGSPQKAPQDIANLYNFPLDGETVETGRIGLIEPGIGSAVPAGDFDDLLTTYLAGIGRSGNGNVYTQSNTAQVYSEEDGGERSLDVGVVAAVNPNSDIGLYVGSGYSGDAYATVFTATQAAIWWDRPAIAAGNTTSWAAVTSSSFWDNVSTAPDSPFYRAYTELFVDAALSNQTTFIALGDGGSGNQLGNGLTNVTYNHTQPWNVLVGGTSLSTTAAAEADPTLDTIVSSAMANDRATIWRLVAGGLMKLPSDAASTEAFVEAVWNNYFVADRDSELVIEGMPNSDFSGGYISNMTGSGGVDVTQPVPSYQAAYGLQPVTSDSQHRIGRGVPDVSANAGGNLTYTAPNPDMVGTDNWDGTSAASPLWAALAVQINLIFQDQNLPNLGYMNDLLYTAAAIAPAAFNDVTLGNNTSSFFEPGNYLTNGTDVSPTGYGYSAGPGYDLTTGLGSPNGVLLARALTAIAHSEMSFDDTVAPVLTSYGAGGWASGTGQSLLIQSVSSSAVGIGVAAEAGSLELHSSATAAYAWNARLAGQSQQLNFDPALVGLFDRQAQGAIGQVTVNTGDSFAVSIDGVAAQAITAPLTNQFGFVDFQTSDGLVRVARPVAVAETVDALNDQTAVVNIRQSGADSLTLTFYRVDDFTGAIGGVDPGDPGYAAAAQARAYQTGTGATSIGGPGYLQFTQAMLQGVDAGDIVAMKLVDNTHGKTYWAFSQANEEVDGEHVGHIWNYGLNTWGWEDTFGGGDQDYNDLVVNLDFTSAFGNAWLM